VALALDAEAIEAGRVVFVAPAKEPEAPARRVTSFLGLSGERTEGVLSLMRHELGVDFSQIDLANVARSRREPLLVLHDRTDHEISYAGSEAIASAWAGSSLVTTDGLGHHRILTNGNVVQRAVEFIVQPDSGRTSAAPSSRSESVSGVQ
jgi:S1-C subfamily serine protease